MAQIVKTQARAEINCSSDKFYGFFKNNMSQLVRTHPNNFKSAQLIQGQDNCVGSVKLWNYVLAAGSTAMSAKVRIEAIDEGNRSITYKIVGGDIMQMYKSIQVRLEISQGFAKWNFEYEKAHAGAPSMDQYADFAVAVSKGLDAYLLTH